MDLQSGSLYWPTTLTDVPNYPSLEENITCDILIIGGGSSGAQCAYYLADTGLDVVVVDKRKVGQGSTSTNTALIQYLGEKMVYQLVNSFGEENAIQHLKLCEDAVNEIENAAAALPINPGFSRRDSLYYASYDEDVNKLEQDYQYLTKHGFQVDYLTEKEIGKRYPFRKRAALYSYNDGELNPYKFTLGLLEKAKNQGVRIFEQTEITGEQLHKEQATFYTKTKHGVRFSIQAKHVIIAAGYESLEFKKDKNAVLESSYAVVTNPVKDLSSWYRRTLIWETARPYIYMRTTPDNRIIIGGLDETTSIAAERDAKILHKKEKLITEFNQLFPDIDVKADYYLGAFYGGTHDGLPMIGVYDEYPNCYFLYAYGDNGTVYSMMLAKILREIITSSTSPALDIYLQTRPMLHKVAFS